VTAPVRRRWIAAAGGALLVAGAAALGLAVNDRPAALPERPAAERPELLLLTSLPIVFAEEFSLEGSGSPALAALHSRYTVEPVSITDARTLDGHRLLLMAQPNAQPAEMLVELDRWVRTGGRILLLADPALEWPSERPLGDVSRPPPAFPDTGLLGHWGLRLEAPDEAGPKAFEMNEREIRTVSPGVLVATGKGCAVERNALIARCRIGRGAATVIADADFINVEKRHDSANIQLLLSELARLE